MPALGLGTPSAAVTAGAPKNGRRCCADCAPMQVAWITFVKQKGLSPLQPGQWPVFLAFYAGKGVMIAWTSR